MAITDKKTGPWGLDQVYNKINQGSIWTYSGQQGMMVWGMNGGSNAGKLGLNNTTEQLTQVQLPGNWTHVEVNPDSGDTGVGAINTDGELFVWGPNQYGMLGINSYPPETSSSPIQIPGTTWASVISGKKNMGAVKTDGTLWVWGDARDGAMGQNSGPANLHRSSPIQVGSTNWKSGYLASAAYDRQFLAIKTDGTLWSWGNNDGGRLGINAGGHRSSPIQIPGTTWALCAMGTVNSMAVKTDGTLWTWGDNDYGRLGINEAHGSQWSSPKQIPGTTWKTTGKSLSASGDGMKALKTDGTMWAWGLNNFGQLGQNDRTNRSSPVQIPGTTWNIVDQGKQVNVAIKTDGTLWGFGNGVAGQLPGAYDNRSSPTQLQGSGWEGVSLSYQSYFGITQI